VLPCRPAAGKVKHKGKMFGKFKGGKMGKRYGKWK
jgi:hypothetical protein